MEEYQNRLRTANLITIVTREEYQERKDNEFRKQFSKPTEEEVVSRPLVAVSVTDYHVGQKAIDSGADIVYFSAIFIIKNDTTIR